MFSKLVAKRELVLEKTNVKKLNKGTQLIA